jgi:uncharacterized protein YqeY
MLKDRLNDLIKEAMVNHDTTRLDVMRQIKTIFTNFEKEGKTLTEADEEDLLFKLVSQHADSIKQYKQGNRQDLADKETAELDILNEYLPKQPTDEEIMEYVKQICADFTDENGTVSMKSMKDIMERVRAKYPRANGAVVSTVVKNYGK